MTPELLGLRALKATPDLPARPAIWVLLAQLVRLETLGLLVPPGQLGRKAIPG